MKTSFMLGFLIIISSLSLGAVFGEVKLKGKVLSYDENKVVFVQDGKRMTVPRKFIPNNTVLRVNRSATAVFRSVQEFEQFLKDNKK